MPRTPKTLMVLIPVMAIHLTCRGQDGDRDGCREVESRSLADDEASPEGMTPLEVLALAGEPLETPFTWRWGTAKDEPGVTNATDDAPPGSDVTVSIRVRVERTSETARYVITTKAGNLRDQSSPNCGPEVHVPVRLHLTTSDGALAEVFEHDLIFEMWRRDSGFPDVAIIESVFAFEDLNGWLEPSWEDGKISGDLYAEFGDDKKGNIGISRVRGNEEGYDVAGYWGYYDGTP